MSKALVLLSGGLDSMLAAKVLIEQGVRVTGINFISHFFGATRARKAAEQLGVKLLETDFKTEHLAMVKRPKYGYGSNMNPCVDCHALMLRKTKELMERDEYDFVATGEVLGQRPMSQNPQALKIVANFSGLGDKLVRPLSAKLLDITAPERAELVDREKLLDISGRSRVRQAELATRFGLTDYPSPAGGCLLTDPAFSGRLKTMFANWPETTGEDVELLKYGRVFWCNMENGQSLFIVGRNEKDNEKLEALAKTGDILLNLSGEMGPTTLIRNSKSQNTNPKQSPNPKTQIPSTLMVIIPDSIKIEKLTLNETKPENEIVGIAAMLTGYYSPKVRGKKIKINLNIKR